MKCGVCVKSLQSCLTLCNPVECSYQVPLSMAILQDIRNTGVSCNALLQGAFPDPGIEPASPATPALVGGFFIAEPPGQPQERIKMESFRRHSKLGFYLFKDIVITKMFMETSHPHSQPIKTKGAMRPFQKELLMNIPIVMRWECTAGIRKTPPTKGYLSKTEKHK